MALAGTLLVTTVVTPPPLSGRMWQYLLWVCVGGAAVLYALYFWLIPAAVQYNGTLALLWHDVIVERLLDALTGSTRPQVTFLQSESCLCLSLSLSLCRCSSASVFEIPAELGLHISVCGRETKAPQRSQNAPIPTQKTVP